jgi:hypothetical protein
VKVAEVNQRFKINKERKNQRKRFKKGNTDENVQYLLKNHKNKGKINSILLVADNPATSNIKQANRIIGCKISYLA